MTQDFVHFFDYIPSSSHTIELLYRRKDVVDYLFFVCFSKFRKLTKKSSSFAKIEINVFVSGMHTNDRLNVRTREGKVIVNISEKNPNQVLYVADSIESVIKPHQIGGVRFLYDNIIESPSVYQSSPGKI